MKVLVTAASKHGSTREIGEALAEELAASGVVAEYLDAGSVDSVEPYDAFVVGSAIYMGRWQAEARDFLSGNRAVLENYPVWLFSSGPVGDAEGVGISEEELARLMELLSVEEHYLFAGKLDRGDLGLGERLVTRIVRAPEGDYRNWDEIRAWAREIASALNEPAESEPDAAGDSGSS